MGRRTHRGEILRETEADKNVAPGAQAPWSVTAEETRHLEVPSAGAIMSLRFTHIVACQDPSPFHSCIILHRLDGPHCAYSSIRPWTPALFPPFSCCELCYCTYMCLNPCFPCPRRRFIGQRCQSLLDDSASEPSLTVAGILRGHSPCPSIPAPGANSSGCFSEDMAPHALQRGCNHAPPATLTPWHPPWAG